MNCLKIILIFVFIQQNAAKNLQESIDEPSLSRTKRDELGWNRLANNLNANRSYKQMDSAYVKQLAKKIGVNRFAFLRAVQRRRMAKH